MTEDERKRVFQTLAEGKNKYYVYALCDGKKVPFYIGKGTGARVEQHIADADVIMRMVEENNPPAKVSDKIKRLIAERGAVQCVIIKWGLSENEAFMCESALMNLLEFFRDVKIEQLTNIANGHASEAEKNSVADISTKARTLQQFLEECAIQSRELEEVRIGDRVPHVAFIKINELYRECLNENGEADPEKVEEVTRAMWPLGQGRQDLEYVFALYHQRVVGVFHVAFISEPVCDVYKTEGKLPNFPKFPPALRQIDKWKAQFATVDEAREKLNSSEFELFYNDLLKKVDKRENQTPQTVLKNHRTRVYFQFDDYVPQELQGFRDCIITDSNRPTHFSGRNPVVFNDRYREINLVARRGELPRENVETAAWQELRDRLAKDNWRENGEKVLYRVLDDCPYLDFKILNVDGRNGILEFGVLSEFAQRGEKESFKSKVRTLKAELHDKIQNKVLTFESGAGTSSFGVGFNEAGTYFVLKPSKTGNNASIPFWAMEQRIADFTDRLRDSGIMQYLQNRLKD